MCRAFFDAREFEPNLSDRFKGNGFAWARPFRFLCISHNTYTRVVRTIVSADGSPKTTVPQE